MPDTDPSDPALVVPGAAEIATARARLAGIAHVTPVLTSATLDARLGIRVFLKAENFQRTGSFKFRGAVNAVAALPEAIRRFGVVAYSSGNHAQAVAAAARHFGIPAVIVMPNDAPPPKRAATAEYGARIVTYDRYTEDRVAMARRIAARLGATLVPPFDHHDVVAGQASAAAELLDAVGPLDAVLAPVGGGGLLAGTALALAATCPGAAAIGVEPEAGNDGQQSLARGMRVTIPVPRSLADGALTQCLGALPFAVLRGQGARIVTVPDAALRPAMRFLAERMKLVVEPTGALGLAALQTGAFAAPAGARVGVILSGGNTEFLPEPPTGLPPS